MIRAPPNTIYNNNINNLERINLSFIVYLLAMLIMSAIASCNRDV